MNVTLEIQTTADEQQASMHPKDQMLYCAYLTCEDVSTLSNSNHFKQVGILMNATLEIQTTSDG